jgi:hypothetical protein
VEFPQFVERPPQKLPSRARVAAGAFGFLIFSHAFEGPDLYGTSSFFETMPSKPSLQVRQRTMSPGIRGAEASRSYRKKEDRFAYREI